MGKPLRVLIVEDSEDDALLMIRELKRGGYDTTFEQVETAEAMAAALEKQEWDVIITDYHLPHFSAPEALGLFHQSGLDLPFIVISGTIGEETAVETMKAGAHDYLMKGNLARLAPAIERELREAKVRKERKRAEQALRESEQRYQDLFDSTYDMIQSVALDGHLFFVNKAWRQTLGYTEAEISDLNLFKIIHPEFLSHCQELFSKVIAGESIRNVEVTFIAKDGRRIQLEGNATPRFIGGKVIATQGFFRDITERKKMEDSLRESEQNLIRGQEIGQMGYWKLNPVTQNVEGSDELLKIFELGRDELTLNAFADVVHPEDREYDLKHIQRGIEKGVPWDIEHRLLLKNGNVKWVRAIGEPDLDENGKVTHIIGIVQDVTERKQAEEEIRKFKTISDNAGYGASIASLEGKFIYLNETYAEMHDYSPSELLGRHFSILYPEDQLKILNKSRNQLLKTGVYFAQEVWHQRRDGTTFPTITTAGLIKDDKRRPLYIYSMAIDITQRKQIEEEIAKFKLIADSADYGVVIRSRDSTFSYVNESFAAMHGYTRNELIGQHYSILFTDEQKAVVDEMTARQMKTNKSISQEHWRLRKDGTSFLSYAIGTFVRDEKGEHLFIASTVVDITERKKMEEQLLTSDRLASIGELVSGVAHELNNPLTSVIGFSELLAGRKDLPDDVKEDLEIVNREAQRSASIVKNLLTFTRKQPKEKQATDINKAIAVVLELRTYEQKVSNIQVNTQLAPDLPEIMANNSDLQQVFLNIIVNAEHAMLEAHGKGTITITTQKAGDIIRASFTDDGPGITKENLRHLFDPFFTTKEVGKGTGLGLSICHGTINEHGGMIYVDSEPGKGATFTIELPVATTDNEGSTNENA